MGDGGAGGDHTDIPAAHHAKTNMEPRAVRIARTAVVGRITVGYAAVTVLVLAVEPIAPAQAAIWFAIGHERAGQRTGGIGDNVVEHAIGVVISGVPIVYPLPDVAGHVIEPEPVGVVARLVGVISARPVVVGLVLQSAIVEADRRGPGREAAGEGIAAARPIGQGAVGVGVAAPREHAVGTVEAAARGVFPFRFGWQAVAAVGEGAVAGGKVVARGETIAGTGPVAVANRAKPTHAGDGMQVAVVSDGEGAAGPLDATVSVGAVGVAINVGAPDAIDIVRPNLHQTLSQSRVEELSILQTSQQGCFHVERVHIDVMEGNLVARVGGIHEAEMVAHLVLAGGDPGELRRETIGEECCVGQAAAHRANEEVGQLVLVADEPELEIHIPRAIGQVHHRRRGPVAGRVRTHEEVRVHGRTG